MSDLLTIRALIQDQPVLVQETIDLDGVQTSVRAHYFPLVSTSVVITGGPSAPTSVDEQSGLLTWAIAPDAGAYTLQYQFVQLLDSTIQALLDLQNADDDYADDADTVRMTAAACLDAIASSQALIQKRIKALDIQTDGPAVAKALRDHAASLRQLVVDPKYDERTFDVAEQINDVFGYREKVLKDFLREDL